MTSMLSFAWRQRDSRRSVTSSARRGGNNKDDQSQLTSSPVPDVTTSASSETQQSHGLDQEEESTTTRQDVDHNNNHNSNSNSNHNNNAVPLVTPSTPEGLRPRKSPNQIRQELGLPSHVLDRVHWVPPSSFPMAAAATTTTTATTSTTWHPALGMSRSNSTSLSPQVSNASFYSRSSTYSQNRVAESPNLQIGHAKTAVGALIAMSHTKDRHHHHHHQQELQQQQAIPMLPLRQSSLPPMAASMPHQPVDLFSGMDVLPPREWIDEDEQGLVDDDDDEDSTCSDVDLPYQALLETTPVRGKRNASVQHQTPESASTMSTTTSSNHASPSSNYNWRRSTRDRDNKGVNVSFSSQIGLMADRQGATTTTKPASSYNFDSILAEHHEVTGFVVESDQATNVSAMSQSTSAKDLDEREPPSQASQPQQQQQQLEEEEEADDFYYQYSSGGGEDVMERALRKRKNRNNRQAKEQLLLAVVERLQDDHQLVVDLQASHKPTDQMSDWLVTSDGIAEGLLTGLDPSKRSAIIRQLDSILKEMSVAQPEEFFMSPSQMQGYAQTHSTLFQALVFARTLVLGAVSEMEKENSSSSFACRYQGRRWKCRPGFRSALGIDEIPQSPESVRGGDTSVFSLPSDDNTPHTSNVSLTTTITSYASPMRAGRNGFTDIRPTLETVSALLCRLSRACLDMMDATKTIRAADQLKRTYLKLVALQAPDIRALVDAFELEYIPPLKITRQVSEDEEAGHSRGVPPATTYQSVRRFTSNFAPSIVHRSTILPPMLPMTLPPLQAMSFSENNDNRRQPQVIPSKQSEIDNRHNDSIMSLPQTDDMTSLPSSSSNSHYSQNPTPTSAGGEGMVWLVPPDGKDDSDHDHENDSDEESEEQYDYVDDLRRQVGSTDYDDVDEDGGDQLREGPEEYGCLVLGDDDDRCAAAV